MNLAAALTCVLLVRGGGDVTTPDHGVAVDARIEDPTHLRRIGGHDPRRGQPAGKPVHTAAIGINVAARESGLKA